MKKLFLMLTFLGSVVTTAFAENKIPNPDEPAVYIYTHICEDGTVLAAASNFEWSQAAIDAFHAAPTAECGIQH